MKKISGDLYRTIYGLAIVYNEKDMPLNAGDTVRFEGSAYKVLQVIPPARPDARGALEVRQRGSWFRPAGALR